MEKLFLLVMIAGQRVALPADDVESVVELDSVTPIPLVAPHVAGLFALRSRVLTVIDTLGSLGLGRKEPEGTMQAVIVLCESHPYALRVDQVEDVIAVEGGVAPVRAMLSPGWARVARGVLQFGDEAVLLVDPAALIAGPAAAAA
jgi:purine-binding chemotaxis protein CheW